MESDRTQYGHLNCQTDGDALFPTPYGTYESVEDCTLGECVGDLRAVGNLVSRPGDAF